MSRVRIKSLETVKAVINKGDSKNLRMFHKLTIIPLRDILPLCCLGVFFGKYCFVFKEYQINLPDCPQYGWEVEGKKKKKENTLTA